MNMAQSLGYLDGVAEFVLKKCASVLKNITCIAEELDGSWANQVIFSYTPIRHNATEDFYSNPIFKHGH